MRTVYGSRGPFRRRRTIADNHPRQDVAPRGDGEGAAAVAPGLADLDRQLDAVVPHTDVGHRAAGVGSDVLAGVRCRDPGTTDDPATDVVRVGVLGALVHRGARGFGVGRVDRAAYGRLGCFDVGHRLRAREGSS